MVVVVAGRDSPDTSTVVVEPETETVKPEVKSSVDPSVLMAFTKRWALFRYSSWVSVNATDVVLLVALVSS
jgi:hypothetical protein